MRPETEQYITAIINENIAHGFFRGQSLFAEELNEDLQKNEVLESVGVEGVMKHLLSEYNDGQ